MSKPQVHRLEKPSSVTISPSGFTVNSEDGAVLASSQPQPKKQKLLAEKKQPKPNPKGIDYSKWDNIDVSDDEEVDVGYEDEYADDDYYGDVSMPVRPASNPEPAQADQPVYETKEVATLSTAGGHEDSHWWSQTANDVTVSIVLPLDTRAKELRFDELSEKRLRFCFGKDGVFDRAWAYPIEKPQDEDGEFLDWEVKTVRNAQGDNHRIFHATFRKKSVAGVVVWWKRAFQGDQEIDVTKIESRAKRINQLDTNSTAWAKAHDMFREKAKEHEPVCVDLDEDES
eukprot:c19257_g1_i1.p1 GENE.c19257_g1_i1~~c19257_g1_i1.p1  ORF type:complete len:285 (+),score=65.50 c19257_g1_i1:41-895(+)